MKPETAIRNLYDALRECGYDGPFALRLPEKEVMSMKAQIEASCPGLVSTNSPHYWPSEVVFEFNGIRVGKLSDGRY